MNVITANDTYGRTCVLAIRHIASLHEIPPGQTRITMVNGEVFQIPQHIVTIEKQLVQYLDT